MCSIRDAERNEELGDLHAKDNEIKKAKKYYIEATSIYILQAQLKKNKEFINFANRCYRKSKQLTDKNWNKELTKQELAKKTIEEQNV